MMMHPDTSTTGGFAYGQVTGSTYVTISYGSASNYVNYHEPKINREDWLRCNVELAACRRRCFVPELDRSFRFEGMASKLRWLHLDVRDVPKDHPAPKTAPQPFLRTPVAWAVALRSFR